MKAIITLGCEGYTENNFCFCPRVENVIIDLEIVKMTDNYFNLIQYLDKVVKIFDGPCNKGHIISNAMYKFYEWGYIDEQKHHYLAYFYNMHRRCGLLMEIKPK